MEEGYAKEAEFPEVSPTKSTGGATEGRKWEGPRHNYTAASSEDGLF